MFPTDANQPAIEEIKPREWVVHMNGHQLRQHYFTLQTALTAAQQRGGV